MDWNDLNRINNNQCTTVLTGWKRIHSWEETPYITRMQSPFVNSHTRTVLSMDDDAMYWLFDEKSKSEKMLATQKNWAPVNIKHGLNLKLVYLTPVMARLILYINYGWVEHSSFYPLSKNIKLSNL